MNRNETEVEVGREILGIVMMMGPVARTALALAIIHQTAEQAATVDPEWKAILDGTKANPKYEPGLYEDPATQSICRSVQKSDIAKAYVEYVEKMASEHPKHPKHTRVRKLEA